MVDRLAYRHLKRLYLPCIYSYLPRLTSQVSISTLQSPFPPFSSFLVQFTPESLFIPLVSEPFCLQVNFLCQSFLYLLLTTPPHPLRGSRRSFLPPPHYFQCHSQLRFPLLPPSITGLAVETRWFGQRGFIERFSVVTNAVSK